MTINVIIVFIAEKKKLRENLLYIYIYIYIKIQPKDTQRCKNCNDYRRKEKEILKRRDLKDEWYWNGNLMRRKTDHVSVSTKCTYKGAGFD